MSCNWKNSDGLRCDAESGRKYKCSEHKGLHCCECNKSAWMNCAHPDCEAVLCRNFACIKAHLDSAHAGKHYAQKIAEVPSEKQSEVISEADPCPVCDDPSADRLLITLKSDQNATRLQVSCSKCATAGPVSRTVKLALRAWNRMPRGRPAIYESIRRRGLKIIDRELAQVEVEKFLTPEKQIAVAKMLEAATMAVDTWEM